MKRPRILLLVPAADGSNWYPWLAAKLGAVKCKVVLRCATTPLAALTDECDSDTIVLGHRSGAGPALRLAEQAKVLGLVLVAPYVAGPQVDSVHTPMHDDPVAFQFTKVWRNCGWILQLGSPDDLYMPAPNQMALAQSLHSDFYFLPGRAQYTAVEADDLWAVLAAKLAPQ